MSARLCPRLGFSHSQVIMLLVVHNLSPSQTCISRVPELNIYIYIYISADPWVVCWTLLGGFLTGERSDAAVVGSGNKAMGKSSLLTF